MQRKLTLHYYVLATLLHLGRGMASVTYVLFLRQHGLSFFEVNLVNVAFFTTVALSEIPTGVFADVLGRKRSIVIAFLLYAIGMSWYGMATGFPGFILAEIIAGIAFTFFSGALDSWITNGLKELEVGEADIVGVYRGGEVIMYGSWAACSLAGGMIGNINLAWPWFAGALVCLLGAFYSIAFMPANQALTHHPSWQEKVAEARSVAQAGRNHLKQNEMFRLLVIAAGTITFSVQTANMHWSPFFESFVDGNIAVLGRIALLVPAGLLVGALALRRIGLTDPIRQIALIVGITGLGLALAGSGTNLWFILPPFVLSEVTRGAFGVARKQLINRGVENDNHRATIASVESAANHVAGLVGLALSGLAADYLGIPTTWKISGLILVCASLWFYRRKR